MSRTSTSRPLHRAPRVAVRVLATMIVTLGLIVPASTAASPALVHGSSAVVPATTGPPPPPTQRGNQPCQFEWCQRLIERLCHRIDCTKLAELFRGTAEGSDVAREVLRSNGDKAFTQKWKGDCFEAHHIVPQGNPYGGISKFAQSILNRVGIKADDIDNLAGLRGPDCQQGKPGYKQLKNHPKLRERMAHADTLFKYYYQKVNQVFAEWVRSHGGRLPNEAEVRTILRGIKRDLYSGGKGYIKPGVMPRAADRE